MKPQIPSASRKILAPAEIIYNILADYRNGHPQILPKPHFLSLDVEEGGFGAGTIVRFRMRLLGQTQSFRSLITEPEPGRLLVETDIKSGIATSFHVVPVDNDQHARLTISTELKSRNILEGWIAKMVLQRVYVQELELIAQYAEAKSRHDEPTQAKGRYTAAT